MTTKTISAGKRFMGAKELAEYLDTSINTVYYWTFTKQIPHYKLGNAVKFDVSEIEAWLKTKQVIFRDSTCQTTGEPD